MSSRLLILLVAAGVLLQTGVGRADAIDGDWCSTDGMRMSINGDKITTPGGKHIQGNYSRHASSRHGQLFGAASALLTSVNVCEIAWAYEATFHIQESRDAEEFCDRRHPNICRFPVPPAPRCQVLRLQA
jgi:hypothetical protein